MGKKKIQICKGMACASQGADSILHKIESETGLQKGESNDKISLDICTCTGHCHKAPNIRVNNIVVHSVTTENVITEIDNPTDFSDDVKELEFDLDELTEL